MGSNPTQAMILHCKSCKTVQSKPYSPFCEKCGSLTEIEYPLDRVKLHDSPNPYWRFIELLPVNDKNLLPKNAGYTPLVHATELGKKIGHDQIFLKNETTLPTGTTKYRMAAVALPYLYESGVDHFCTSSTGNSSTAYAAFIENIPGMKVSIFTGSEFETRVALPESNQIDHYVLEGGTFVEAFDCAAEYAANHGFTSERGFFNVGRREGLKLAFCEASDQMPGEINWYVQAVSSAMGVYGSWKAAKELKTIGSIKTLPHLLCVQQESCSPMVQAWKENSAEIEAHHIVKRPVGIAKAILRGNPSKVYPYMREIVSESKGGFESVSESQIREARQLVMETENIDICFSSATAVAGLIKSVRNGMVPNKDTVLINLTGSDRPESAPRASNIRLVRENGEWVTTA